METKITQVVFGEGPRRARETVITREDFNALMGAYMINGVEVSSDWVYGPGEAGGQLIMLRTSKGHVHSFWYAEPIMAAGV